MSQAVKQLIYGLLANDAPLNAMLARDPQDVAGLAPAIMNARWSDKPPVFDAVTYRCTTTSNDSRFRPANPLGAGSTNSALQFETAYVNFEIWTHASNSTNLEAIRQRIDLYLHQTQATSGLLNVFLSERQTLAEDNYDKDTKARFTLLKYRMRYTYGAVSQPTTVTSLTTGASILTGGFTFAPSTTITTPSTPTTTTTTTGGSIITMGLGRSKLITSGY